ncbi:MAG: prepilin-type N-terminal cleavage/methylation domain-containing protein [Elusimicrobiales bacterium]
MKKTGTSAAWGFTLIELMIVVAIIGILAMVAVPKFADLINKSKEGATKGSLGAVRAALTVYYGDQEGQYPVDNLASLTTNAKYLDSIPQSKTPPMHTDSSAVNATGSATNVSDANGWAYNNMRTETGAFSWGTLLVNCSHTNSKGERWTAIGL